jgi:hypothetical protein
MRLVPLALAVLLCTTVLHAYKPVLFMHGVGGNYAGYKIIIDYIPLRHPNTTTIFIGTIFALS